MPARQERQPGAADAGQEQTSQSSATGATPAAEGRGTNAPEAQRQIPISGEGSGAQQSQPRQRAEAAQGQGLTRQPRVSPPLSSWELGRLSPWDLMRLGPWELMRRMSDDFDQLFAGFPETGRAALAPQHSSYTGLGGRGAPSLTGGGTFVPQLDVIQRPNEIVVRADLPGLEPDDIDVTVEDGMLTISGERQAEQREERAGFVRTERSYGSFHRTIALPNAADEDKVAASFRNGVLEITIPVTTERERGKKVKVQG